MIDTTDPTDRAKRRFPTSPSRKTMLSTTTNGISIPAWMIFLHLGNRLGLPRAALNHLASNQCQELRR